MEVYAALLLGFVAEGNAHQQKVNTGSVLLNETKNWLSLLHTSTEHAIHLMTWLTLRVEHSLWCRHANQDCEIKIYQPDSVRSSHLPACTMRAEDTLQLLFVLWWSNACSAADAV